MTSISKPTELAAKVNLDHQKYRPDIDGLRAIAVILVLLFHFELGVSGGFVGVDVFFVISGYLITDVIRKSVIAGRFSFLDFYVRRLLRLHPALIVTVCICLVAGFLLVDPASFSTIAHSATYSIFSASNFYFWLNQGYFDAASKTQPLLHTWSLAAEWQFYIIWPFLVWSALKISDRFLAALLALMTIGSLASSQIMLGIDASAAYFMMPFRVFELSIGALLVFFSVRRAPPVSESIIALAGLLLIIASAFAFDAASPFPGLLALAPCLGAAACIYAGRSRVGAILRTWPMVKIGLISYSVYLVHWPLLVFYKYYIFREITQSEKIAMLVLSIVIGALMYASVERLFLGKGRLIKPIGLTAVSVAVCALSVGCIVVINHDGMKSRIPDEYRSFISDPANFHRNNYGGYSYDLNANLGDTEGAKLAVLGGDSFALQYASGIDGILKKSKEYMEGEFQHGCIVSSEYTRATNNVPLAGCRETYKKVLAKLESNNIPLVLAQHWAGYRGEIVNSKNEIVPSTSDNDYKTVLLDILEKTRIDIGDRKMVLIGSQPILAGGSSATCLMRPAYFKQECEKYLSYDLSSSSSLYTNAILKNFASAHVNTYYIDPADSLCVDGKCKTYEAGKIFYSDSVHLSIDGSAVASARIISEIKKILRN